MSYVLLRVTCPSPQPHPKKKGLNKCPTDRSPVIQQTKETLCTSLFFVVRERTLKLSKLHLFYPVKHKITYIKNL